MKFENLNWRRNLKDQFRPPSPLNAYERASFIFLIVLYSLLFLITSMLTLKNILRGENLALLSVNTALLCVMGASLAFLRWHKRGVIIGTLVLSLINAIGLPILVVSRDFINHPSVHWALAIPVINALLLRPKLAWIVTGATLVGLWSIVPFLEIGAVSVAGHQMSMTPTNEMLYVSTQVIFVGLVAHIFELSRKKLITELEASKEVANERRVAAEAGAESKSRFLAQISHEIRTPMNGIIGQIESLQEVRTRKEVEELIGSVRNSSHTLMTILNDVLDAAALESGKLQITRRDFLLHKLVLDVKELFAGTCRLKGLELSLSLEDGTPDWVHGDSVRIHQCLMNLIGNAVKFTLKGSVAIVVKPVDEGVRFRISDTGPGMTPDELERCFAPFERIINDKAPAQGGTGLGLHIVRSIAEALGGKIEVESTVGAGSVFSLEIPLAPATAERERALEGQAQAIEYPQFQLRVLVVDDNAINHSVARRALRRLGCETHEAFGGQEALRLIEVAESEHPFDLVLMDAQMPEMDGLETTRQVHQLRLDLTVFAHSASVFPEQLVAFQEAGMIEFVPKPLNLKGLCLLLEKHFAHAKSTGANGNVHDEAV